MKRLLLTFCVLVTAIAVQAQVIFYVQSPAGLAGNYETTWADPGGGDWSTPDLTDPANAIIDTLMFVDDGTAGDSLGCNPLVNDLTGKIAVIYRGDCEFGAKSLNAQNAGAVGVVIINNVAGAPIEMGGGAVGTSVTIPVAMITMDAGADLKSAIDAGQVTAFIGTKLGYFANDIGSIPAFVLLPPASAMPHFLAGDDTEWALELGLWVINFGTADQIGTVALNAEVTLGGNSLYNETVTVDTLNSGDSVFVALPDFSQTSYTSGYYKLTYSLSITGGDDFPDDNAFPANFYLSDSLFAHAPIDENTLMPVSTAHYRPSNANTIDFSSCIHFRDPNASRMEAVGITATASGGPADTLTNQPVEATLYEWNDQFIGVSDTANIGITDLNKVGSGIYFYLSDLQQERIYIPFDNPVPLVDDQRYLFCFTTLSEGIYHGYNSQIDHLLTRFVYDQPISIVENPAATPTTWFWPGFGTEVTPSIGARIRSNLVGLDEPQVSDITPYPNPAKDMITIPYRSMIGDALLKIVDVSGRVVGSQPVSMDGSGQLRVDVSDISAGMYVFNLVLKNGKQHAFNVMIGR